jgi:anti-sigma28 factor (negative regulator of flagellin synthesis)
MKKLIILFLLVAGNVFSQNHNAIEKLLNKELIKELKFRINNSYYEVDTLIIV